jgi:hypothetical protein
MAIQFVPGQVAVSDPNAAYPNPTATSNIKDVVIKVVKLTSANFTITTATSTLVAVLPADATILAFTYWNKTKLVGGTISAAALSLGTSSAGTQFVSAFDVFTTVGTQALISPVTGIMQNYNIPLGSDIQIWATGLATTSNPTGGEIYLTIEYVR